MAKNMLKNYGRFVRIEALPHLLLAESERRLEEARKDFESRIEELRMRGAAKDLQIRMKKIEEQLRVMQRLTSVDVDLEALPTREEIENATGEKLEENDVNG